MFGQKRATTALLVKNSRPITLPEFQEMFERIYGEKNGRDYKNTSDLVRRLMEEGCSIMELARKDPASKNPYRLQLANVFSWWTALANRTDTDLHEALWYKFPGTCSYCRKTACVCGLEHPEEIHADEKEALLRRLRKERTKMPKTLEDHRILHAKLYGGQNKRILPIQIAAHLVEEMGEVSTALRHANKKEFYNEMADVGSWIFALATRLEFVPFDEVVWEVYSYECNVCHNEVCSCEHMV